MLKKILVIVLALIMALSMVACGGGEDNKTNNTHEEALIGEWIGSVQNKDAYKEGLHFAEDRTCNAFGESYTWEFINADSNGANFLIKNGETEVYKVLMQDYKEGSFNSFRLSVGISGKGSVGQFYKGSDLTKIEVTIDNWNQYLEIIDGPMKVEEVADKAVSAEVKSYIVLKEVYGEICSPLSEGVITFNYIPQERNATVDLGTKTYELGSVAYENRLFTEKHDMGIQKFGGKRTFGINYNTLYFNELPSTTVGAVDNLTVTDVLAVIYCFK